MDVRFVRMHVKACKTRGFWGHASPGKLDAVRLLLRPFWDRSKAVVAIYIAREVLHPIFDCPCMHLLSQLTSNFQGTKEGTKFGRTAGGVTSL